MIRPLFIASLIMSATAVAAELPIERVFSAPALDGPAPRGVKFSPDGMLVTYLRPESTDQTTFDLWARPVSGGKAMRLIEGSKVEPRDALLSEEEKSRRERQRSVGVHGVVDYAWDAAGKQILIPAGGNLYLADAKTRVMKKLGETGGGSTDAKISAQGRYVTYVRDQNLHALDLKTGADVAITTEGGGAVSFGTAEFVAQEEMDRYTGYWVSPDQKRIAFTRIDEGPVDIVPLVEIGADGTTVLNKRYPRAGRPNARVELYISPLSGGSRVRADLGADADVYLARVDWSRDAAILYVQRESRDQTRLELLAVDPVSGAARVVITEHQIPWINLNNDFTPLKTGDFIWGSERSGFHHLYLYSAGGALIRQITHGEWPVAQSSGAGAHPSAVAGVDEEKGRVYFIASKNSPLEQHLYVTSYREPGEPRQITLGEGWWNVDLAKDTKIFVGTYTDPSTPPRTAIYSADGQRLSWIEENKMGPGHPYFAYIDRKTFPEYGTLRAEDGQTLHYSITKPDGFDAGKRYPAIVNVYGGPGARPVVRKAWSGGTDQLLTQAGYVVFRLDNRGTSNRGLKFEAPIHKALGGPEVQDQIAGVRFLAALPYIDARRIGVMGWSYGGFMTLRLLTEPGAGVAAGAAGGPPSDWRLYDTHYTERYLGDPRDDGAAYEQAALIPRLSGLAKPGAPRLLLLHGMADDNVVFENSTRIMAALQDHSIPFDLMLYPGQRHGIRTPTKEAQLWETYLGFFGRVLQEHGAGAGSH